MDWLYAMPHWLVILVMTCGLAPLFIGLKILIGRWTGHRLAGQEYDFTLQMGHGLSLMLSFILGFAVVEVLYDQAKVQANLTQEARNLDALDQVLLAFDQEALATWRQDLTRYTESVLEDEWPALQEGFGSERTRRLMIPVVNAVYRFQPTTPHEEILYARAIELVEQISKLRQERILSAQTKLHPVFWLLIALVFLANLCVLSVLPGSLFYYVLLALYLASFTAVIAFILVFDRPFKGEGKVSSRPYVEALQTMRRRS